MKRLAPLLLLLIAGNAQADTLAGHTVVLDPQGRIVPWYLPAANAYDEFLDRRWNFVKTSVPLSPPPPPRSLYPQYYFYDGYVTTSPTIEPDYWMNDIGEKIPNWFESARLYYAYTGDASVMTIVRGMIDYVLEHGTSPAGFAWPNFPYTTTNHGEIEFDGFQPQFAQHETHVDLAGEMGLAYFGMYEFTGDPEYLAAAIDVADALAASARVGTATESVWPYRVRMDTGEITAEYGANWMGCYDLLSRLVEAGLGNVAAYDAARDLARDFVLQFPMQTGYWTDGHSDNPVDSNTYRSNTCKSNAVLYLFDHPEFDPNWQTHIPAMIDWTETYFVFRTTGGEPATAYGANIVGEQDGFLYKMDYQTARYAAECARWYRASGDAAYLEKAYRALNWVTYCSDADGRATESPYSLGIATWWSDCYGECPRMFYHAFAGMPEWAPPGEDHLVYSADVIRDVDYAAGAVTYTAADGDGIDYLRLSFLPGTVTADGVGLAPRSDLNAQGYTVRSLGGGDHAVAIRRAAGGSTGTIVQILASGLPLIIDVTERFQTIDGLGVNVNSRSWDANELTPVLDAFIDDAGMNLFRVIYDNTDWEATNDNADPNVFNWGHYDTIFSSAAFEKFWDTIEYLNQRGITDGICLNFMGPGPAWLGGASLASGQEDEWAEMVTAALIYARQTRGLQFTLVSPNNEPDIYNEGIHMTAGQYAVCLNRLAIRLDGSGLGDIRFIAPDAAGDGSYKDPIVADPVVMAKLVHWGTHGYSPGAGSSGVLDFIENSAYPDRDFWQTEFNVWLPGGDTGQRGTYDWAYCSGTFDYLLSHLDNGASAGLVWEGFDSVYAHHGYSWSFWGLIGVDDEYAAQKTYAPRKHFYTVSQISKFIRPGMARVSSSAEDPNLIHMAFHDAASQRVVIVGHNTDSQPTTLAGSMIGVAPTTLEFYQTSATLDLFRAMDVPVTGNAFQTQIPANTIFTLVTPAVPDTEPPTAPTNLTATDGYAAVSLAWTASTDNVGVAGYDIHRSVTPGFTPSPGNRVAQTVGLTTSFAPSTPAGTYYFRVVARDYAGNLSGPSNEVAGTSLEDTEVPAVALTSPANSATVSGVITVAANATDNAGVAGVSFFVDGAIIGVEDTTAPYSVYWTTGAVANGWHTLSAVARDVGGNQTASTPRSVNVQNDPGTLGLVGAWGFDEGSGTTVFDQSGHGNTGVVWQTEWTAGKFGGALSFNGSSSWVTVADATTLRLTTGMTLEAWVYPTGSLSGWRSVIIKEANSDLSYALYATDPDQSPSAPSTFVRIGGQNISTWGSSALPPNVWTHLAGTYDGAFLRMYVNGALVHSTPVSGNIVDTGDVLRFGGNSVWGEYFEGLIDEVRIYNRALTATEIQADMVRPLTVNAIPAVSEWGMAITTSLLLVLAAGVITRRQAQRSTAA